MLIVHHEELLDLMRFAYAPGEAAQIGGFLEGKGAFQFLMVGHGLFRASASDDAAGYENVWVRDNVLIAWAHRRTGRTAAALATLDGLMRYFTKHRRRFLEVVAGDADPNDPMQRPHVRFHGPDLEEVDQKWSHAQNDALGYFLWEYCSQSLAGLREPTSEEWETLGAFARYLAAIKYWQDEDSGHWEETRKISASSIGTATAGLERLLSLAESPAGKGKLRFEGRPLAVDEARRSISAAREKLKKLLPWECRQKDPKKSRRADGALLFLLYPLETVDDATGNRILENLPELQGEIGVRRYVGDSYWCADYKELLARDERTADFSDDVGRRDQFLKPGQEAQWCIFDPMLSAMYGRRFLQSKSPADLRRQTHFLNRSLAQVTGPEAASGPWRCPESYYLSQGRWVPNDVTPLLWTQANLMVALDAMERSLASGG